LKFEVHVRVCNVYYLNYYYFFNFMPFILIYRKHVRGRTRIFGKAIVMPKNANAKGKSIDNCTVAYIKISAASIERAA
jgi:hypothetical protein